MGSLPVRFGLIYGGYFLFMGLFAPYWPLWLKGRGLSAGEIGIVIALTQILKMATAPIIAQIADETGRRRLVLLVSALAAPLLFVFYGVPGGYFWLVAVTFLCHLALPAILPLTEQMAVIAVRRDGMHYGRVRAVGSFAFIAASLAGGVLIDHLGIPSLYGACLLMLCLLPVAVLSLPGDGNGGRSPSQGRFLSPAITLLRRRDILLLLVTVSCIQGSHGMYYAMGTIHWRALELSSSIIGVLWAAGVAAEIVLFVTVGRHMKPEKVGKVLILIAALSALRWTLTAVIVTPEWLLPTQCLHAASFAATHLATISYLAAAAPEGQGASAQALYSALPMGLAAGLSIAVSGPLYETFHGNAYLAMAALCALGLIFAVKFSRQASQGRLPH